tara:strand:+ start:3940 stop:5976 length:2037 start_codon:yes stop_codon:yes gene_type:complete
MSEYFIEIYGEDIPSWSQIEAEKFIFNFFSHHMNQKQIPFDQIKVFSSSKRIGCSLSGVPSIRKSEVILLKGPAVGSNEQAILGFMKSNNITNKKLLKKKKINYKEYFFYEKTIPEIYYLEIFQELTINILHNFKWKTSMRWSNITEKWIRPIKNIVCFFDNNIIDLSFAGIKTCNKFYGNTYYKESTFKFKNFRDYKKVLEKELVYIYRDERIERIVKQLENIEATKKLTFNYDKSLLIECANFCENPVIFQGQFDKKFFNMPQIFIQTILKEKQKYFSFRDCEGNLSNIFAFVANNKEDSTMKIRNDHQKVLEARLKDTLFFINDDLNIQLYDRREKLKDIIYFEGVGNLYEKTQRLLEISKTFCKEITLELTPEMEKIILICKSDLTTQVINEFPSLQGKVGYYYASKQDFQKDYCKAIMEQYLPNNLDNNVPKMKLSICLSLVEKLDHIVGAFIANKKPSGSKDPYAIRRAVIGLIRILIENKISVNLENYINQIIGLYKIENIKIQKEILNFIDTRLKIYLKELGYDTKVQNAVSVNCKNNPYMLFEKSIILLKISEKKIFQDFLNSYKRLHSLLQNQDIKDTVPNEDLFKSSEEKELLKTMSDFKKYIDTESDHFSYETSFNKLFKIHNFINNFLDNNIVNVDDPQIRANRLYLLKHCKLQLEKHTIFSEIL